MRRIALFYPLLLISVILSSCEFKCSVGDVKDDKPGSIKKKEPIHQDGAIIYNGIELRTGIVKLKKAYLVFKNGEKVPDDNFIDFQQPVKLLLIIDSGWQVFNKKVKLGASEKILAENGKTLMDNPDLFESMSDGITEEDAKIIGLTVTLSLEKGSPPTYFTIRFKVWDKLGGGDIEGSYKLYSK